MMRRTSVLLALALLCGLGRAAVCMAADPEVKTSEKRDTLLYVHTDPSGAKVYLNGKELGKSDDVFAVDPGVGTIVIELPGHETNKKQVTIQANKVTRLALILKPQVAAGGGDDAAQLAQQGWQLWQGGKMDEAAVKFQKAVKLAPNLQNAWNGLGWASFNSGKLPEAQKAFERLLVLNPKHPAGLNGLGQLFLAQKKYDLAETYLLKAAPEAPAAWFGLTRLYLLQGKFEEARKFAQRIEDSGQGDESSRKMLQAAKDKQLSDGLRFMIEPRLATSESTDAENGQAGQAESSPKNPASESAFLSEQLREAKTGNVWAKYRLWAAYHKGTDGVEKNPEEAKKWLAEVVKGVYLAKFRPVKGFDPKTPGEFLSNFNGHSSLRSEQTSIGGASFFRTKNKDGVLIGSFLTEYPEKMRKAIADNPSLKLVSMEELTPEMFVAYEASVQESLDSGDETGHSQSEGARAKQQVNARKRMRQDANAFSAQELAQIESLYQVANQKWRSPEARDSLKTLVEKYKKANRTGCAILYLGQMTHGDEQIAYFKQAIADHSDCFYGDGVQVGAFARFLLGHTYLQSGNTELAEPLFDEIRKNYPDSVNHNGDSLVAQIPQGATDNGQSDKANRPQDAEIMKSANNLKQLALAMLMYESAHGHLPPAVLYGPDGKTPHSWRVELLPFLDSKLYDQYHLDEPWDGPNNIKLLDKMPAGAFRSPKDSPKSKNTSYFVLVGPGTIFENEKGCMIAHIYDGCSNTILLVEAKRDIPWTKPEDIAYDPEKPLPKLGGWFERGFNVAFADGAELFLHNPKDKILRTLITRNDGETVDREKLEQLPTETAVAPDNTIHAIDEAVSTISICAEGDPRVTQAMKSLKGLDSSDVVKGLVSYLDSPIDTVRRSAIYILWKGHFADITPAVPALKKLLGHDEEFTRGMAALALGQNKVSSSYDDLVKMTASDSSGYARRCGAISLGWLGDQRAVPALEAAMKDEDPLVKHNAKTALDMLKAGEAPSGEASASEVPALKAVGKAQEAAKAWLALIDDAKYAAGWDGAAAMLKDKVEKDFCVESIKAARAPFGTVKSRTLKSATYTTTLPGAPEGEYVVIQYDTQFENKSEVIETITPMLEKDGSWKVSGYFLKPVEKSKDAKPADSPAADSLKQSDSVETAVQSEQGSAGTENLLNNPGAEKGDETPEAWQQGDPIEGVKYSWDKKVASEGKASLCIEKTAKRYFPIAQWSQTVERKGDSSILEVSAQVKAQRMTKAVLDVLFLDKDGQWISHKWGAYIGSKKNGDPPANHNWKKYSGKVDVPPGTAKICIGLQVYGPGKVWFDDLRASYENSEPKNEKPDAIEEPSPRE